MELWLGANLYWNLLASAGLHQHLHTEKEMLQIEENANIMALCQNFCMYFHKVRKKSQTKTKTFS